MIVEVNLSEDPSAQPASWEGMELSLREASEHRAAAAARLNYLAMDRPDILFASKECSRRMSSPRNGDWTALKRVVRYLLGKPRLVWRYTWQEKPKFLSAFSDSNWAGCHDTRKSTSGACFMHGAHLIKAYSHPEQYCLKLWGGCVLWFSGNGIRGARNGCNDRGFWRQN